MKRIFVTVDVECHDLKKQNQYIWGKVGNEEYGIREILELGKQFDIPINFFVDVAECERYGTDFVQKIIDTILEYNQNVYLHLHPNYISNDDKKSYLWQYSIEEQIEILKKGFDYYYKLTKRDTCPAFRVGRYGANSDMYDALNKLEIQTNDLSYCYESEKMCHISKGEIGTANLNTIYKNQNILPNTRYIGIDLFGVTRYLHLDAADTQLGEFKQFINNNKLENIVMTMHSWNFINKYFFLSDYIGGNKKNIKKFIEMVNCAKEKGYVFSDIERDFIGGNSQKCDQVQNLCSGFSGKILSIIRNYIRFKNIGKLNKKYFFIYGIFYSILIILVFFILNKFI